MISKRVFVRDLPTEAILVYNYVFVRILGRHAVLEARVVVQVADGVMRLAVYVRKETAVNFLDAGSP